VLVCTYSSVPATDENTFGSHFLKRTSVVSSRWLQSLQRNRIGDLSLFSSVGEQEEVAWCKVRKVGRVWKRWNVVFRHKFICGDGPVGRDIVMMQDPTAGAPLLMAMSAHSVAEALQDCF